MSRGHKEQDIVLSSVTTEVTVDLHQITIRSFSFMHLGRFRRSYHTTYNILPDRNAVDAGDEWY